MHISDGCIKGCWLPTATSRLTMSAKKNRMMNSSCEMVPNNNEYEEFIKMATEQQTVMPAR